MKKNWFFIVMLSIAALVLAGTAAYFSVFGLSKLFFAAGWGITILAAALEFAKLVTVSYVYRFWKTIKKALRGFYIFAVVFIMFLTSVGIYGFLTGAYQQSANKLEMRDSQIKIAENKKILFVNQLDRVNKSIESSSSRINTLSGLRGQQEKRLDNLYSQKYVGVAKRTESQISGSDEQIKLLNVDITDKMKQTTSINDSIAYYDQKIIDLKSSDISNEVGPYKFISDLTGIPMNTVVAWVAFFIILVFDPLAIALLIGVNQLTMISEKKEEVIKDEPVEEEPIIKEEEIEVENEEEYFIDEEFLIESSTEQDKGKTMVEKLKEHLSSITREEFQKEWDELDKFDETDYLSEIKPFTPVEHNTFGKGLVLDIQGDDATVKFEKFGVKNLSLRLAKLKSIVELEKVEPQPQPKFINNATTKKEYDEFEPQQIASVNVNTAHFVPDSEL
jgi:hypothetical protein